MIIFNEPSYIAFVGVLIAISSFAVQLFLCFKTKSKVTKYIPICLIVLFGMLILLISTGILGNSSGFLGNAHLLVAAILAVIDGLALVGVATAWIVYKLNLQKRDKRRAK